MGGRARSIGLLASTLALGAAVCGCSPQTAPDRCDESGDAVGLQVLKVGPDAEYFVLADSMSAGVGLENSDQVWLRDLAVHSQATVTVDAQEDTGFVNAGACGDHAFRDRIDRLVDARSVEGWDTLIVQGGNDDVGADPKKVEAAAVALLSEIPNTPEHQVVLVGPADAPGRQGEREISRALQRAARVSNVGFVPMINIRLEFQPDGIHLTSQGQSIFAAALIRSIAEGD